VDVAVYKRMCVYWAQAGRIGATISKKRSLRTSMRCGCNFETLCSITMLFSSDLPRQPDDGTILVENEVRCSR
jgi:hypothetical protein